MMAASVAAPEQAVEDGHEQRGDDGDVEAEMAMMCKSLKACWSRAAGRFRPRMPARSEALVGEDAVNDSQSALQGVDGAQDGIAAAKGKRVASAEGM